jgi:putative ABC transport system permease protein
MFYNLKIAIRNLRRNGLYSIINIAGLGIGFTAVLLIFIYVWQESHYDNFHKRKSNLYRISISTERDGVSSRSPVFLAPLGVAMKEEIPEVDLSTRVTGAWEFTASYQQSSLKIKNVCFADTSFFQMFFFPLKEGNPLTALTAPFSIVLTEETAVKLFGNDNPIGKTILVDGENNYTVTGIVQKPPQNSQFKFTALASFSTLYRLPNRWMGWDGGNQYTTFILLNEKAGVSSVNSKLDKILWDNLGKYYEKAQVSLKGHLEPIQDIHLYYDNNSLRFSLYVLMSIAILTLVVACINFVNMTTARSLRRAKGAAMCKIIGAKKQSIIQQFLGESMFVSFAAFLVSILMLKFCEPLFYQLTGISLYWTNSTVVFGLALLFVLSVITGFIGGSYPAFFLSSLPLELAMKGGKVKTGKRRMQNILLTVQFAISSGLIICTMVVSKQLDYIHNIDLGYNREHILVLPVTENPTADKLPLLKQRILTLQEVQFAAGSSTLPSTFTEKSGYIPEGMSDYVMIHVVDADPDFLNVYGISLLEGNFFSDERPTDKMGYVVNEKLVKTLGWNDDAIGKNIFRNGQHQVIGIVKDYNYNSLYDAIEPLIITNIPWENRYRTLSIKFNARDIRAFVKSIQKIWTEVNPNSPFEYHFFDDIFNREYKDVERFRSLFFTFTFISISLALLGMLSLMAYTVEQRKKEISIRKILGASLFDIWRLLTQNTVVIICLANILIWPVVWMIMNQLLAFFAYRIAIGWPTFIVAFLLSLFIALITIGFQVVKAVTANPVDAIKTE